MEILGELFAFGDESGLHIISDAAEVR